MVDVIVVSLSHSSFQRQGTRIQQQLSPSLGDVEQLRQGCKRLEYRRRLRSSNEHRIHNDLEGVKRDIDRCWTVSLTSV